MPVRTGCRLNPFILGLKASYHASLAAAWTARARTWAETARDESRPEADRDEAALVALAAHHEAHAEYRRARLCTHKAHEAALVLVRSVRRRRGRVTADEHLSMLADAVVW